MGTLNFGPPPSQRMGLSFSSIFVRGVEDVLLAATRGFKDPKHRTASTVSRAAKRVAFVVTVAADLHDFRWDPETRCVQVTPQPDTGAWDAAFHSAVVGTARERQKLARMWRVHVDVAQQLRKCHHAMLKDLRGKTKRPRGPGGSHRPTHAPPTFPPSPIETLDEMISEASRLLCESVLLRICGSDSLLVEMCDPSYTTTIEAEQTKHVDRCDLLHTLIPHMSRTLRDIAVLRQARKTVAAFGPRWDALVHLRLRRQRPQRKASGASGASGASPVNPWPPLAALRTVVGVEWVRGTLVPRVALPVPTEDAEGAEGGTKPEGAEEPEELPKAVVEARVALMLATALVPAYDTRSPAYLDFDATTTKFVNDIANLVLSPDPA